MTLFFFYRQIVKDEEQELPYEVLMTKCDAHLGEWGLYNFYQIQVTQIKAVERGLQVWTKNWLLLIHVCYLVADCLILQFLLLFTDPMV